MFDFESSPLIAPLMEMQAIHSMADAMTKPYLAHPKIKELLRSNEKFDICLMEIFNYDALNYGIADHFGCTIVNYSEVLFTQFIRRYILLGIVCNLACG